MGKERWRRARPAVTTRLSLYIPQKLADRLNKLREQGIDINISSVLQDALEKVCDEAEKPAPGWPSTKR